MFKGTLIEQQWDSGTCTQSGKIKEASTISKLRGKHRIPDITPVYNIHVLLSLLL